jgi:subtilisin family serine protease
MPIIKVFAPRVDYSKVARKVSRVIEKYDAFILVDATRPAKNGLARTYPVEDVTSQYELQLGAGRPRAPRPATRYRREAGLSRGPHHYVVQFVGPIKRSWLSRVKATGAKLRAPHGNFAYVAWAQEKTLPKIGALPFVRWIGHLPHSKRVAPGLLGPARTPVTAPRRRPREGVFTVEIFDEKDAGRIARSARAAGFKVLAKEPKARLLVVESRADSARRRKQIQALSAIHGVRYIRQRVLKRTSNDVATGIMGNKYVATSASGPQLSATGEIVAVCDTGIDTGDPATVHPDFAGRILAIKSYPVTSDWSSYASNVGADDGAADVDSGHGTHTSGSALGNGSASGGGAGSIRGHAYKAKLVFQAVEQEMKWKPTAPAQFRKERYILAGLPPDMKPLFQYAYGQGARIHSNSWGGGDPGEYDDQCRQFDQFVWDHKDFCFVVAAGNDGSDADGDGKVNLGSVSSPGTAKNCITVGACESRRRQFDSETYGAWWPDDFPVRPLANEPMADDPDEIVPFSSRGPTRDKRLKPEVIAPGTYILSTRSTRIAPNNFAWAAYPPNKANYFFMGGTSMATPLTAGAAAVVRQFLRTKRGIASPSAALIKAVLVAGAKRLPGTGPAGTLCDNNQGFGRVNLDRSLKRRPLATIDGAGLSTGQKATFTVKVGSANKTVRIALCYSDYPGDSLVNNLNLIVTDPAGKRYTGNLSPAQGGSLTLDTTNNTEVVEVAKAKKGAWTVDVVASNVGSGPQDFGLAAVLV